jgi:HTH-type transcriptional regulator, sugar sensing transcriptional regulator
MQQLFTNLGLNKKEAETFLKLLELGAQPISVIAKQIGIPRSTMYTIIDQLTKLHLVENFERVGIRYVKCIPVKDIEGVLKSKERKIEQTINLLNENLPQLESLENNLSYAPRIKYYEGKEGIMKMYEGVLQEEGFSAFFNPALVKKHMPQYHYEIPETMRKRKMKALEIITISPAAQEYKKLYQSKIHQIKILPKDAKLPSDTIICKDKIYMVSYGEKDMAGIEIINQSLATSQQTIFNQLWQRY